MICPNCGSELPQGSRFCNICGKSVSQNNTTTLRENNIAAKADSQRKNAYVQRTDNQYIQNVQNYQQIFPQRSKKKNKSVIAVAIIAAVIILVGGACVLYSMFALVKIEVPTGSMKNTINAGDRVTVSRIAYNFDEPERGDIIAFKYPDDYAKGKTTYYVKRIIGLPGETVTITGGQVYITDKNGKTEMLEEDYVVGETYEGTNNSTGVYKVPEDSYFVMGDNREDSADSRFWTTTSYVDEELIIGKVMFRYYPSIDKLE